MNPFLFFYLYSQYSSIPSHTFQVRYLSGNSYNHFDMRLAKIRRSIDHSNSKAEEFQVKLDGERSYTEWGCLIVFCLILFGTFGGGIYILVEQNASNMMTTSQTPDPSLNTAIGSSIIRNIHIIGLILVLSLGLTILITFLMKTFPKPVSYFLIGISISLKMIMSCIGFLIHNITLGFLFLAILTILIIQTIILCWQWENFKKSLSLTRSASTFMKEKPAVYYVSGIFVLINSVFLVFWLYTWIRILLTSIVLLEYLWYFVGIFWCYFLYYSQVFIIASVCTHWYENSDKNSLVAKFKNIIYHLGSITQVSLIVGFVKFLKIFSYLNQIRRLRIIFAGLCPCFKSLLKVFDDSYSVILVAVTSKGYIDSASTACSLIMDNLGFFKIVRSFDRVFISLSIVPACIMPGLIGGSLVYDKERSMQSPVAVSSGVSTITGVLTNSLDCIYIFYCLDKKEASLIATKISEVLPEGEAQQDPTEAALQCTDYNKK